MFTRIAIMTFIAFVLGAILGQLEIQILGTQGWASGLPVTIVMKDNIFLDFLCAGRPLTSYHMWLLVFLTVMVHLPAALIGGWNLKLEARALGCLGLIWIVRDVWWFLANPTIGWAGIDPVRAPWIKKWLMGFPSDWIIIIPISIGFIVWSYILHVREETKKVEFEEPMA